MPDPAVPLTEKGKVTSGSSWWESTDDEHVPELRWPLSVDVFDKMRRGDSQVTSVLRAVTLPIRRTPWRLDPAGARDEVVHLISEDLGLPVQGADPEAPMVRRSRDRFSWQEHLRMALLMLPFGHMFFEQVVRFDEDNRVRLRKLGPRMPRTITAVNVADDGGLVSIDQAAGASKVTIPVDRLVAYVFDREGGNWLGMALATDTPIPTPDGWRAMGDLEVGDRVFDERGMIRHVVAVRDWTERPCYEITFGDGETIVADENHQWLTHDFRYRCQGRGAPAVRTTSEIASSVKATKSGTSNHAIPLAGAAEYVAQHLLVHPYVLGYWLGDGAKGSGRIVTADREVFDRFAECGYPCEVADRWEEDRAATAKGLAADLRRVGVIDHKHVPEHYLRGSVEQRLDLLRGLMDSDGTITAQGQCVFANTDPLLVSAVLELVRSLGIRATATVRRQAGRTSIGPRGETIRSRRDVWHVQFATHLPVFSLQRKACRLKPDNIRRRYHVIKAVERVANRDTRCIEVDSPSHLFLAGKGFVPTHNSLLRPAYKHWIIKDRLLRVQAQTIERNGMGIPKYKGAEGEESLVAGLAMAQGWRAGSSAAAAVPNGADLVLEGVTGTLPDAMPAIRYHDEQIARTVLAHFLNLGTQTGSWALGSTFADFFALSLQALGEQIADVATQHIVEDLVDWNYGPDEPAPKVTFDEIGSQPAAMASALKMLVDSGVILPDRVLEEFIRQTLGLPAKAFPPPASAA